MFVVTDDGQWVNEDFERLASVIRDYNADFELQWIPPQARTNPEDFAKPYRIVHHSKTKGSYTIFTFSELETPQAVLSRLFENDLSKHSKNEIWNKLMAVEAAQEVLKLKKQQDDFEDAEDKAKFLFNNPLHTKRFNGKKLDGHSLRTLGPAVDRKHL